jgi:hypothetical protein
MCMPASFSLSRARSQLPLLPESAYQVRRLAAEAVGHVAAVGVAASKDAGRVDTHTLRHIRHHAAREPACERGQSQAMCGCVGSKGGRSGHTRTPRRQCSRSVRGRSSRHLGPPHSSIISHAHRQRRISHRPTQAHTKIMHMINHTQAPHMASTCARTVPRVLIALRHHSNKALLLRHLRFKTSPAPPISNRPNDALPTGALRGTEKKCMCPCLSLSGWKGVCAHGHGQCWRPRYG